MEALEHQLQLETFHQLLHNQLMPWLPENNSFLFYKAWQQYMYEHKGPYLIRLLQVYERNRRPLSPDLPQEWRVISRAALKPEMRNLILSLKELPFSGIKLFFYRDLIAYAFAHSLCYFELQVKHFSDARRQFALRQLMRRLDDLYDSSVSLFRAQQHEDAAVMYLVHLCVVMFREHLIEYFHTELTPDFILHNKELIQPNHLKDYPMHKLPNALYQRYHKDYLPLMATKQKPYSMPEQRFSSPENDEDSLLALLGQGAETPPEASPPHSAPKQESNRATPEEGKETKEPLLSTAEAARLLGVSANGLRNKAKRGEITYLKIGRLVKFERHTIEHFIKRNNT